MSLVDQIAKLNELDLSEIDFSSAGLWPKSAKLAVLIVVAIAAFAAGYYLMIAPSLKELSSVTEREASLKKVFEVRANQASNIEGYRIQNEQLVKRFDDLLNQLPSQTEVPGLIEDITTVGVSGGLRIEKIDLNDEVAREFFIELPMSIELVGSYHNFGAFVSGVSSLSRIVTLHDYQIRNSRNGQLSMVIKAKTYRYRD